jgi:hypothetical protein
VLLARRWQVRVGQGLAGDGLGVLPVGLVPSPAAATLGGAVGLHLADVIAGRDQGLGDVPAKPGRAFHPDPSDLEREAVQQRHGLGESLR